MKTEYRFILVNTQIASFLMKLYPELYF